MVDEKELLQRYSSSSTLRQDFIEQQLMYREADLESRAAAAAAATAAIHDREIIVERERDREFALQLAAGPPIAHQRDYVAESRQVATAIAHHSRAVEYSIQPPVAHSQAAAIAASAAQQQNALEWWAKHVVAVQPQAPLQAPPPAQYVPVTMVEQNGVRQQIAIPPPPAPPPPAHMQPALFPGHPQVAAAAQAYGYAPLSPGKTRYLY